MLYTISTPNGIGVELWGTRDDLVDLHDVISRFWGDENMYNVSGYENRNLLISSFSYEIRKSYEGSRMKRVGNHYETSREEYFGAQYSWVHILFSITALRHNMRYVVPTKFDIARFLDLEFWIEKSMNGYSRENAGALIPFIENGIHGGNKYLYHYMRVINLEYINLGGGKATFKKLPSLLKKAILGTDEFRNYQEYLETEAQKSGCEVNDLELDDNGFNYDRIKW